MAAASAPTATATRRPAFRYARLAEPLWRLCEAGPRWAREGDRVGAVRALFALDAVAQLPSPGLARLARQGAARTRAALQSAIAAEVVAERRIAS